MQQNVLTTCLGSTSSVGSEHAAVQRCLLHQM